MDSLTLASAAVAVLLPYLAKAGEGAAAKIGEETGSTLFGWMRTKLSGRGQEALDDLVANPGSEENQADLRKQLAKALETDPALTTELSAMLPTASKSAPSMVQDVSGSGAKAAQVKGSGNTTTIS